MPDETYASLDDDINLIKIIINLYIWGLYAEVQFSDIIQVATIGLTLATLKLGLEQFLTRSLIAERQDILKREKEFENEHNEAIEELQKTIQQDPEAIEPQNENNLARYHSKQEDLQAFDIKYFLNSPLLHVAIVVVYAISVYFAAIQFSEMPYLFQLNSWIFKKLTLEYSAVTIFNCTAPTFIFQSVVLAHFVAKQPNYEENCINTRATFPV